MNGYPDQSFDVSALPEEERSLLRWFEEAYGHFAQDIVAIWPQAQFKLSNHYQFVTYEEAQLLKNEILATIHSWIKKNVYIDFFHYNHLAAAYFALNTIKPP
jgi:FKBP-type peptidyl-prolyl cis-trans isomerase 2